MKSEPKSHLVAFLDILGFKEYVKNYVSGDTAILNKIQTALENASNNVYHTIKINEESDDMNFEINYNQFSDCTSISFWHPSLHLKENTDSVNPGLLTAILILRDFQIELLESDVYIRGGLSFGIHFENNNMIFSEGLVNSYELESKKALYPRIIFDNEVSDMLKIMFENYKEAMVYYGIDKMLLFDWDSELFINPFTKRESLKNFIGIEGYEKDKQPKTPEKTHELIEWCKFEGLKQEDKDSQLNILKNVKSHISKLESDKEEIDYNTLRKYLWLQELIKWNIDPESSKIKFEFLLK